MAPLSTAKANVKMAVHLWSHRGVTGGAFLIAYAIYCMNLHLLQTHPGRHIEC